MKYLLSLIFLLAGFSGCATVGYRREIALKRAWFDLECDQAKIKITELTSDNRNSTFGVKGCGKKAVYIVDCGQNIGHGCTAILNTQNKDDKATKAQDAPRD